ncbi:MAG: Gfo/Idh/MocA family oxidoreductase, partial [Rhodospirillales bacterium]
RVGIVGIGYGQSVLVPAFRLSSVAQITALAASTEERARAVADRLDIPLAFGNWNALFDQVDAVAVAVPPSLQPEIVEAALARGLPVFCEKPLAITVGRAERMVAAATAAGVATCVDFMFQTIPAWVEARRLLEQGEIGPLRHIAVQWEVETFSNQHKKSSWKTDPSQGGGTLFNFGPHVFHYLEWLFGPILALSARLTKAPNDPRQGETLVTMAVEFKNGLTGSVSICTSAYLGQGHRLAVFGDEGSLVLHNPTNDYAKGFALWRAGRGDLALTPVAVDGSWEEWQQDGRILATAALAGRFLEDIATRQRRAPQLADGLCVQRLLDGAERSHRTGQMIVL